MDTIFAAIIGALAGFISSLIVCRWQNKNAEILCNRQIESEKLMYINDLLLQLNLITITYPFLEDDEFCASWIDNRKNKDEKFIRYENYCCLVFNLLSEIWKFHNGDKKKIEEHFGIMEIVERHKGWWLFPSGLGENIHGYQAQFRYFINSYIK